MDLHVTKGEKIFYIINYILLTLFAISIILPFMNVVSISLSSKTAILKGDVNFLPVNFNLASYKYVIGSEQFWNSLKVSVIVTLAGTILSVTLTFLAAYPLSKTNLKLRKPVLYFFVFIMLFNGGIVPNYILIQGLGLYNTIFVLFIPFLISTYNLLLIKNYLETLPEELEESALIDGANKIQVLFYIILPLAKPVLATVALFTAVMFWNSYFPGILYLSDKSLQPLQTYIYELLRAVQNIGEGEVNPEMLALLDTEGIRAATIVLSLIPIVAVYPFVQKYFVKGLVVGSIK